jgi:hypothetical protein
MRFYPTAALATIAFAALIEPSFAGALTVPGPVAGIGLPALAVVGGIYWVGRKLLKPNE